MKTKYLIMLSAALMAWSCNDDKCTDCNTPEAVVTVETPAEAQQALNNGSTTVTISQPLTSDVMFSIPGDYLTKTTVNLIMDANGNDVTVQEATGTGEHPAINLTTGNADAVIINTPNSSVSYTGTASNMEATTAATTLTVTKGSTVDNITVKQGSLKIFGTINNITNNGSGKVYLAIGSGSDRPTIGDETIKNTLAITWADGMILTEGKYPLNMNIESTSPTANSSIYPDGWYMPIDRDGYEVLGEGNRDNIILYGKEYQGNGNWNTQNLVTVFASNVTFDNITLKVKDESNKTIEILGENFTIRNCAIVPNDEIVLQNTKADGGSVYFNGGTTSIDGGKVENCYFKGATLSVDGFRTGTITATGNTFDGANYYGKVISTRNWTPGLDISNSDMKLNLDQTTFSNISTWGGNSDASVPGSYPAFTVDYGTVTLTNATGLGNGIYWQITGKGKLVINGTNYTAPVK